MKMAVLTNRSLDIDHKRAEGQHNKASNINQLNLDS